VTERGSGEKINRLDLGWLWRAAKKQEAAKKLTFVFL
jgi:hypothetical protein